MSTFDEGGQLFAALTYLNNNGYTARSGKNYVVQSTAVAFFDATRTCAQSAEIASRLTINCNPTIDYRRSLACQECMAVQSKLLAQREALEKEASVLSGGTYTPQKLSSHVTWSSPNLANDICRNFCAACVVAGIEQEQHVHLDATCDLSADKFVTTMRRSMEATIDEIVNRHEKDIKNVNDGLNIPKAKEELIDTMLATFQAKYTASMRESVLSWQSLEIDTSESIVVNNVTQSFSATVSQSIVSSLYVNESVYNQQQINSQIRIYSENSNNLSPRSIYNTIENTVTSLWSVVRFRIMVIVGLLLVLAVVGIVAFLVVEKQKKVNAQRAASRA